MTPGASLLPRLPNPARWMMQDLADFAEAPLAPVAQANVNHWRRGFGTFEAICPHRRLDTFSEAGRASRVATTARFVVALTAQLTVSVTAGVVAGYCIGLLLTVGRREQARAIAAQQIYPLCVVAFVAQVGSVVCCAVGACVLLGGVL